MVLAELSEFLHVNTFGVINPFDRHATHHCTCWVGTVRRLGDDADISVALTLTLEVLADDQ